MYVPDINCPSYKCFRESDITDAPLEYMEIRIVLSIIKGKQFFPAYCVKSQMWATALFFISNVQFSLDV